MFRGVWIGKSIPEKDRILILGESHYGEFNPEEDTTSVVAEYIRQVKQCDKRRWSRFFDCIANSFGYTDDKSAFYDKVYFGNYVEVPCGVGNDKAEQNIKINRINYNNHLFEFINEYKIKTICCFSRLVYNNLPSLSDHENEELLAVYNENTKRNGYLGYYVYSPEIERNNTTIKLNNALSVIGVMHPASRGFDYMIVHDFLTKREELRWIIKKG